jgi:hypothetical protein
MHNSGAFAPRDGEVASTVDDEMDMNPRAIPAFAGTAERVYRGCPDQEDRFASNSPKE